jgi:hypothetical protein
MLELSWYVSSGTYLQKDVNIKVKDIPDLVESEGLKSPLLSSCLGRISHEPES